MEHRSFTSSRTGGRAATAALVVAASLLTVAGQGAGAAAATAARTGQAQSASAHQPSVGIFTGSLRSALSIDIAHETVTLPLYSGRTSGGETIWYVVTESSNRAEATRRGLNYSGKLANALGTAAVQNARLVHGALVFEGTVNFSKKRVVVPGPNGFPPTRYAAGAKGDAHYSPLVHLPNGAVINAPQVANRTGKSGSVVAIDYRHRTVTLNLLAGFVDGQFTVYLHTDASSPLIAALENSTYTPNLNAAPGLGSDEPSSSRAAIIPVVNGIHGDAEPERQGLESALLSQGDPFNVAQEQPSDPVHYSPIWDVTPVKWTEAAVAAGKRHQLHSQEEVRREALAGNVVSALPGTPDTGLGGINSSGAISNCPIIAVFPG
ncbi:MAG: hypothetical protein ABSG95_14315 [Solirubrobacteraceae bacterium]|jgi:hypothetical protein